MSNHASSRIDGGRRPNRRSNPKKDKGGSGGGGGSGGNSTGSGTGGKGGDPFRFEGEGLIFRAKLIGSQAVPEARGDRMCQDTMTRLKMAVRASGEHKQRVQLTVSLQGIKIRDDKTGELVFHHPVHRISFISQDASDARAFGYVCMTQDGCHRFIAIKTEKAASQLVVALRDLFQVVLEMKQHELRMAQQEQRQQLQAWTPPTDFSNRLAVQEVICSPEGASSGDPPPVPETTPTVDDLLDLQSELDCLQEGIQQMETTIAAAATLASPDPFDTSFVFDPRQQYHPGSRAFMSEPVTPVGPPPPLLPPPPPVARATTQSTIFGGTAQQQHRAVPPPRTLPFGTLPQATASLPPTPLPDLFADLDPLSEGGSSSKGRIGFGELRSPPKPLAELLKPISGWQTFDEEDEEDEGPPPPAFPPPPPPLTAVDEGFCSGSNASSVSPSLPPVATATITATAAAFSSSSNTNNIFNRCGGQDPFADEFFAAPSTPGSKDFTANASPARPALLPGLSTNSSPWPMSPQTTALLRR